MVYCLTFLCWQDKLYMLQHEEYRNLNTRHSYLHIHTNSYSTISSDTIFYGIWYQCIRSTLNCESSTTFYTIIEMKKITHKNSENYFPVPQCQWSHKQFAANENTNPKLIVLDLLTRWKYNFHIQPFHLLTPWPLGDMAVILKIVLKIHYTG